MQAYFIGVDGGATKCIVRLEDAAGNLLGQANSGPANIRISVLDAWQSIHHALNKILQSSALTLDKTKNYFHIGMGLAGSEVCDAKQKFLAYLNQQQLFNTIVLTSDAHIACLGAHAGSDGAIIIAGTGVVGYQIYRNKVSKVSGWGFPHDDEGGGAWIGLQAIKLTLKWLDGREMQSELAKAIYDYFKNDHTHLINWANQANSTAFAELAPIVMKCSAAGDEAALSILQQAAKAIDAVGDALFLKSDANLPCALVGGITPFLQPYLSKTLQSRLRASLKTPDAGAIFLIREHLEGKEKR